MLLSGKSVKLLFYALAATFLFSGCYTQLQFSEQQRQSDAAYNSYSQQQGNVSADNVKERPRVGLQANRALDDTSYAMGYVDGWKESSYHYTDYNTRNYWDSFYSWNRYPRFNMYDRYHSRFSMSFHDPFFYDRYPVYQFGFSFGYSNYPHYFMASRRYYDPYRTGFGFGSYYSGYPTYTGWTGKGVVVSDRDKIDKPRGSGVTRAAPTPGLSSSGGSEVSREKTSNWERLRRAIETRLTPRNSGKSYDSPRSSSSTRISNPSGSGTRRSSGTSVGRSRSGSSSSSGNTRSSSGSSSSGSRNDSPRSSGSDRSSGDNSRSDSSDSRNSD